MALTLNPLSTLEMFSNLPNFLRSSGAKSLLEYTSSSRIEPNAMIEAGIWNADYMPDVIQSATSMFASMYLAAVSLSTVIDGVTVAGKLDQFSTNRQPLNSMADTIASMVAIEQFKFGLPPISQVATEGVLFDRLIGKDEDASTPATVGQTTVRENLNVLRENNNLSVGKTLNVEFTVNGEKASATVNVRMNTIPVPAKGLINILEGGAPDTNTKERGWKVKTGELHWLWDMVGCADLLDKRRKAILNDPTGIYLKTIKDQRRNSMAGWLSGKPSVAQASNIVVMSKDTARDLERQLTIRMDKFKERERLFENSSILVIYVIDDNYNHVDAYFRTIEGHTSFSLSSMKNAVKGGVDIKQMMDMVIGNRAPTF
jgi:hypothetical protein